MPPRVDLSGLPFADFLAWGRGLVGHGDRFHRALYRQVLTTGTFAPRSLAAWREAEAQRPGVIAILEAAAASVQRPTVVRTRAGHDPQHGETIKLVIRLHDGLEAEAVLIPMRAADGQASHHTLCVSSQVGCKMGCAFCHTASMGLVRQLVVVQDMHLMRPPRSNVNHVPLHTESRPDEAGFLRYRVSWSLL